MSQADTQKIGRLAFREKGDMWVAYYAPSNTMEEAIEIGSISMVMVHHPNHPERKEQFIRMMRDCLGDIIEDKYGHRPEWGEQQKAPGHERLQ